MVDSADGKVNTDGNWYDSLPSDVHEHVKGYDNQEAMVRDSISNREKIKDIPVIPKRDEYKHEPEGEKLEGDKLKSYEGMINQTKDFAEKNGLTQAQFTQIVNERIKMADAAQMQKIKRYEDGIASLKKEWGESFDANLKKADQVAGMFPESFKKVFYSDENKSALNHNAAFIMGMFELSKKFGEDSLIKSGEGDDQDADVGKDGIRRDPITGYPMLTYNKTK
jgi:hypothetical protein